MRRPRLGALPWHPALLAAAIVVTAWLDAAVSPFAAFRSLAVAIVVAAVLTGLVAAIARSWQIGGIVATAIVAVLWSRQLIDTAADVIGRAGPVLAAVWVVLIVAVLVLATMLIRRRARGATRDDVTRFLNRAAGLLLVASLAFGVVSGRLFSLLPDLEQGTSLDAWAASTDEPSRSAERPDIYAILLDGYPRADVLEYAFGIDNSAFLSALADRGFELPDAAHSDYLWTHVTVPSALNLDYVENIPAMRAVMEGHAARQPTLRRVVADATALDVAGDAGYTTIAVAPGFEEVALRQADVYVDGGQLNEFEISLLATTFAGDVVNAVNPDFASSALRGRILANLRVLPQIAAADAGPALVLAHVPAPHQPVVFAADGGPVAVPIQKSWFADSPSERGEDPDEYRERYRAQLPYLNERILEAIDGILAASDEPPVIVLYADHGSASVVDWNETDPLEADPARLLERTGILFAAHTPGREEVFPDDISPVDLFRLLYDAYLGTDYGRAAPPADGGHVPSVDASVLDR